MDIVTSLDQYNTLLLKAVHDEPQRVGLGLLTK